MSNLKVKTTVSEPLELNSEQFEDLFDEIKPFSKAIEVITERQEDIPDILSNVNDSEELVSSLELLLNILESADTVEDISTNVDTAYKKVENTYEENIMSIFEKTKPFEKIIRSLHLLYENAGDKANVLILPVNPEKFANSGNPKHFNLMVKFLRKEFFKWKMDDSPFYISYIGDIGGKSAMDAMAKIAFKTCALAVVDTKETSNLKSIIEHAKRISIKEIAAKKGHLVVPATWVYPLGAKDVKFVQNEQGEYKRIKTKMAVGASGAFIGKLLEASPGVFITGLESDAILGIDGVKLKYDEERIDSKTLDKVGLVQIEPSGHIQGSTTTNKSSTKELTKFHTVDASNALRKDIIQFCNNKSFSKWGKAQKKEFRREIEIYLNGRIKDELIEGYEIIYLDYDENDENVTIEILINFFKIADEFMIDMHGSQGGIDFPEKESK